MSVAVCSSPASGFESILMLARKETDSLPLPRLEESAKTRPPPVQFDMWTSILARKPARNQDAPPPYYVHHPTRTRSTSSNGLLSQQSLKICTESLGSESGSDDYFSSDDESKFFSSIPFPPSSPLPIKQEKLELIEEGSTILRRNINRAVNYHCTSISRSKSCAAPRSFPPPLPSISRRDGPCVQMRPHRKDGRLVLEAVTVPLQNYLHAERQNGRLLLSFINTTTTSYPTYTQDEKDVKEVLNVEEEEEEEEEMEEEEEEEEEEEVQVVDRGTMVEVKVSTQPQQQSKVHRSSIVINKFVSCTPTADHTSNYTTEPEAVVRPLSPVRRLPSTATTTAAAAAVAASSVSTLSDAGDTITTDNKLLFTSKRRNREEMLHDMRRCSQLKKPLFIWEPCCIATSTN